MDRATLDRLKSRGFTFSDRHEELADIQTRNDLLKEEYRKNKKYLNNIDINQLNKDIAIRKFYLISKFTLIAIVFTDLLFYY